MRRLVRRAAVAALVVSSGCIAEGRYHVRGRVLRDDGGVAAPVAGAAVKVGDGEGRPVARTGADGVYEADYAFGGVWPFVRGAAPAVDVAAAGYRARRVALKGPAAEAGVTRADCAPAEKGCFVLDVVLDPEGAAAGR